MPSPWTYSTTGYQLVGKTHEEICQLCLAAGLAGIEGVPPLFAELRSNEIDAVATLYKTQGLKIDSFHLPFAPEDDMASFYKSIRNEAVNTMRKWMECAASLGARVVILHPTTSRANFQVEGLDPYLRALGDSLSQLLPAAEDLKLTIAVENMLPGPYGRLGASPDHFRAIHKEFAHANLGFCLDTGHALVAAWDKAEEFLDAMEPALAAFHLADNAGDRDSHLAPGHGRVDWNSVFRKMKKVGFADVACIETPPFDFGPNFTTEAWGRMVLNTDKLAAAALQKAAI
jgi:sugar phosphate isomerase/epimerase